MRALALSLVCNNACVFCAQGELRLAIDVQGARAMTDAALQSAIADVVPGETVALIGGEPTLDERLPDVVHKLHEAGVERIVVQTNGRRLAYRSYASFLRKASDRLSLEISIAGSTEAMHDYLTGTQGSFKQTIVGLRNARSEGIQTSVSHVVTRSSFRHLSEVVRLASAVSASALRFVPALPLGNAFVYRDRVVPAPELVAPYLALALAEAEKLGLPVLVGATGTPDELGPSVFAGLGPVEPESASALRKKANAAQKIAAEAPAVRPASPRSLPLLGRPSPGKREERGPSRKTGDELRPLFPSLFDGSAPRTVADVVAASRIAAEPIGGGR